jgi:hypothetical protein
MGLFDWLFEPKRKNSTVEDIEAFKEAVLKRLDEQTNINITIQHPPQDTSTLTVTAESLPLIEGEEILEPEILKQYPVGSKEWKEQYASRFRGE